MRQHVVPGENPDLERELPAVWRCGAQLIDRRAVAVDLAVRAQQRAPGVIVAFGAE